MNRYRTRITDGSVLVESDGEPIEIGSLETILGLVGGETYEITYEEDYAKAVDWLDLDDEDAMSIDVAETIADMDYPEPFVRELEERSHEPDEGPSERTRYFVDIMTDIWDHHGNLDHRDENPFQ